MTNLPPYVSPALFADRPFPELLALDIDDTVVMPDGIVEEPVVEAIARAKDAGITVVFATGRTLSTTAPIGRACDVTGWSVCSNGAAIVTIEPETIIESITFDPRPVLEKLVEEIPEAVFAVEDVHGVIRTTKIFGESALGLSIIHVPFEHLFEQPAARVVVRSDAHLNEGFVSVASKLNLHSVVFGVSSTAWMDIGPQGISKATGLETLCTRLDLNPARTLVIGDSWNDYEMLKWAGTSIAMGVAPEAVALAADAMTSPIAGQGVVEVIDALLSAK